MNSTATEHEFRIDRNCLVFAVYEVGERSENNRVYQCFVLTPITSSCAHCSASCVGIHELQIQTQ